MIFPCVDLMRGKVVQLVRGRVPALELDPSPELLARFAAFPQIHVIDLDAALDRGSNAALFTPWLAARRVRVGGGIRTAQSARQWLARGAHRVIVGTAAFNQDGIHRELLRQIPRRRLIIALDSSQGRVVVRGWRKSLDLSAEEAVRELEPYCSGFLCTCVDKEGMMQGTDLAWFRRLRRITAHELTAAGGIASLRELRALARLDIHAALGMSVYTGRLSLADLAAFGRARVAPGPGKIAPDPPNSQPRPQRECEAGAVGPRRSVAGSPGERAAERSEAGRPRSTNAARDQSSPPAINQRRPRSINGNGRSPG